MSLYADPRDYELARVTGSDPSMSNPSTVFGVRRGEPAKYKIDKSFFDSDEYKGLDPNRAGTAAFTYSPYFGTAGSGTIGDVDQAYRAYAKRIGFNPDADYSAPLKYEQVAEPARPPSTGNENMAETEEKLKGKTGEELRKSVISKEAELSDKTSLSPSEKIVLEKQQVRSGELMNPLAYDVRQTTAKAPDEIDVSKFKQDQPTKTTSPTYNASTVGDIGKMGAVSGDVSTEATMTAAQGTASADSLATAATEQLDAKATVSYQMAELFKGIESGTELPAWAAPSVRKVSAIMAQRGLGSSSMASAAMIQAIYESGVPIAVADANKYATIQLQNLNNKQQAAIQNATVVATMDTANLNNRQMAAVNNAKSFLSMDMQNLNNEQQKATIDFQQRVSGMFTDAAQSNAAKQFNAKTQGEIDQFFAELGVSVENTALNRNAALEQYNVSQATAVEQFNAQMVSQREQFNSNNRKQIDASNAQWRRTINTAETAAINEENRTNLQTLLNMSNQAQNNLWQLYRDQAGWAMSTSENNLDRAHNAAMQAAAISERADMYDDKFDDFLIIKTIDNIFG
tara:strand:- start:4559 stop:6271 length:1713 start_codon:yes stop_codon:yes gene_type:complete